MSMGYVRKMYGVPVKRGGRVKVKQHFYSSVEWDGAITRCTQYVWVRLDGHRHAYPYHPADPTLVYLEAANGRKR